MDASILRELTSDQLKSDIPEFSAGDTLRVHVRVVKETRNVSRSLKELYYKERGLGYTRRSQFERSPKECQPSVYSPYIHHAFLRSNVRVGDASDEHA